MGSTADDKGRGSVQKFGTFLGVFTPSVLTILGLIMYLRFGWVLGNVGLPYAAFMLLLASSITFITGLSASALATNMKVGVGGEYYLVSRSLGLELGGAIGIPLFLCRTLSITFYSFGLAESIASLVPIEAMPRDVFIQVVAATTVIVITSVSGKSASLALKLQVPIMAAVGLSILALAAGVFSGGTREPEWTATFRTAPEGFWYVFAVFFPAVTGFTAGIGMSGDLKDTQKSIPRGTLLAVVTGSLVYLGIMVLLGITDKAGFDDLATKGVDVWVMIAVGGAWLVFPGVWGAILSSAFGSALGGPRVLQALANDGLAPRFLARTSSTGQPAVATFASGAIALAAVLIGELNAVAQFVSILFLTLYVAINLSAAFERLAGDPSFRPTIRVPWYVSLAGSLGAVWVMFLISPIACIVAVVLETCLYVALRRRAMQKRWGDVRAGLWTALTRYSLLRLRDHKGDSRNWRPQILLFVGDVRKRIKLLRMASWFSQNRGIITACRLIVGDPMRDVVDTGTMRREMDEIVSDEGLVAFGEVDVVDDFETGVVEIAQANGIAGLQSNTLMFGWPEKEGRLSAILRIMSSVSKIGKSTIIARINWAHEPGQTKRIDLWWRGKHSNGDMMLLLAYLLTLNHEWNTARITVRSIVNSQKARDEMEKSLSTLLKDVRIRAQTEVIVKPEGMSVNDVIHSYSGSADVVFLGMMITKEGAEDESASQMEQVSNGLRTTIFVLNSSEFAGKLI